jgi:hypothetical protein
MEKIFEIEEHILKSGKGVAAAVALAFVGVLIMAAGFGLMIYFS